MKVELALLVGPESKAFLVDLQKTVDRMEKLALGKNPSDVDTVEIEVVKTKTKKEPVSLDDEDDEDADAEDDEDEDQDDEDDDAADDDEDDEDFTAAKKTAKPKAAVKATKKKKVTLDDVNAACRDLAKASGGKEKGRAVVLKILKKHFDTQTVSDLEPDQFEACIEAMKVPQ